MREPDFGSQRTRMVERHLVRRGIRDPGVVSAMSTVPREAFVPPEMRVYAYRDAALPLSAGQTISQPYIVAAMAEALQLKPEDRVLEVGTGSGYAAAVLSLLAATVDTVERIPELADTAAERLERLGFDNVSVHLGDGSRGWPANAPYDGICVAAAAPDVPEALLDQLNDGGRLVVPVGPLTGPQRLVRVRKEGDRWAEDPLGEVRFVPLVGEEGWDGDDTGWS